MEWNAKNVEKDIYFLLVFEKKKNLKIDILQQKSFLVQFLSPINDTTLFYIPFDREFNKQQNYIQHMGK